jgi:hypothetical protein
VQFAGDHGAGERDFDGTAGFDFQSQAAGQSHRDARLGGILGLQRQVEQGQRGTPLGRSRPDLDQRQSELAHGVSGRGKAKQLARQLIRQPHHLPDSKRASVKVAAKWVRQAKRLHVLLHDQQLGLGRSAAVGIRDLQFLFDSRDDVRLAGYRLTVGLRLGVGSTESDGGGLVGDSCLLRAGLARFQDHQLTLLLPLQLLLLSLDDLAVLTDGKRQIQVAVELLSGRVADLSDSPLKGDLLGDYRLGGAQHDRQAANGEELEAHGTVP